MPLLRALIFAAPVKKEVASGFPKTYDALPLLHIKMNKEALPALCNLS
jgi:hypothetical protein